MGGYARIARQIAAENIRNYQNSFPKGRSQQEISTWASFGYRPEGLTPVQANGALVLPASACTQHELDMSMTRQGHFIDVIKDMQKGYLPPFGTFVPAEK